MAPRKKKSEKITPPTTQPCPDCQNVEDPEPGADCATCSGTGLVPLVVVVEPAGPRTPEQSRMALQRKVRMFYDLQRLRIQAAGRTQEQAPGIEIKLHADDLAVLTVRAGELHKQEKEALRDVANHLAMLPAYQALFPADDDELRKRWKGCGVTLCGVLFSAVDIHRAHTVSSLWKFAGLDVVPAERCSTCTAVAEVGKPHPKGKCVFAGKPVTAAMLVPSGKKPHRTKGEKSPYNGWLRSKLIGVLGPNMLKAGSPYRKFYDDYKHRKLSAGWGTSDGHRHAAALRYMVKQFLADFWAAWRTHEGLEVRPRYQEQYLGHTHHESAPAPPA